MPEDFSLEELHALVDRALGSGVPAPKASGYKTPLGLGDSRLLENLGPALVAVGVHQGDIQVVFDRLRSSLLKDLNLPKLQDIHSVSLHCRRCPGLDGPAELPEGNLADPDLVVVMENSRDNSELVQRGLKDAGLDLGRVAFTYATRCKTPKRAPEPTELNNCFGYLTSEIQVLAPKLILTLGANVAESFVGPIKVTEDHGRIFWTGPWAVMCLYSPGYINRREGAEAEFYADLAKAKEFLYG